MGNCLFLRRGAAPSSEPQLGDLEPGTLISIGENGVQIPFLLLIHDYPAQERSLLLRQNCLENARWGVTGDYYFESTADGYCNSYHLSLDVSVANQIIDVGIQSYAGYGDLQILNRKCFLLSATELGDTEADVEGSAIPYFDSVQSRICVQDGTSTARNWWTRTRENSSEAWRVTTAGGLNTNTKGGALYYRPAFTLPSNFEPTLWEA